MTTAVLEFKAREDLDKLMKAAKIFGIYTKERKINSLAAAKKIYENEIIHKGIEATKRIQQQAVAAGLDKMTLEEINEEIAEVRKERAIKQKCLA